MASRYTKKIPMYVYFVGDGEWIQGPYVNPQKGRVNRKFLLTEVPITIDEQIKKIKKVKIT